MSSREEAGFFGVAIVDFAPGASQSKRMTLALLPFSDSLNS